MENKMKVLLAVDGSPCSDAAVAEVAARPWPPGSEFKVFSAFPLPINPAPEAWAIPPEYYNELERAARTQAQQIVDRALAKLRGTLDESMIVVGRVTPGSAPAGIVEEADRWPADLIIVGSHGYGTWRRLVLGSVSQAVVLHAKCSVEVVRRCEKENEEAA